MLTLQSKIPLPFSMVQPTSGNRTAVKGTIPPLIFNSERIIAHTHTSAT